MGDRRSARGHKAYDSAPRREALAEAGIIDGIMHRGHARRPLTAWLRWMNTALAPKRYQSGETDRRGAISKVGDTATRVALFEAAHVLLTRVAKWSALKAWGVRLAQRRGAKLAKVALARKLACVLHRIWVSEAEFRYAAPAAAMEA
jgi:transposase